MDRHHLSTASLVSAAIFLLATTVGCGSGADSVYTSDSGGELAQLIRRHVPIKVDPDKANRMLREQAQRGIDLGDAFVSELKSATDDDSARAAIEQMQELYDKFQEKSRIRHMVVELPPNSRTVIYSWGEEEIAAAKKRWLQAVNEYERSQRGNRNISPQVKHHLDSTFALLRSAPFDIDCSMSMGSSEETTIFVKGDDVSLGLGEYLKDKHEGRVTNERIDGTYAKVTLGEVEIDEVEEMLDIGKVTESNKNLNCMLVVLSDDEKSNFRVREKERLAEVARQEKAEQEKIAADEKKKLEEKKIKYAEPIAEPLAKRDELLTTILTTLKSMKDIPSVRAGIKPIEATRSDYRRAASDLERQLSSYERAIEEKYVFDDKAPALMAQIQAEIDRMNKDSLLRILFIRELSPEMKTQAFLEQTWTIKDPARDDEHPDYLLCNWFDLVYGSSSDRRYALERIAEIDPNTVKDSELRGQVARAIRNYYEIASTYQKADAIIPLSKWGGKHSVPLLLKILKEDLDSHNASELIAALRPYPSAEVANVVADCVGNRHAHELACKFLVEMGPLAEDPVMRIAPSDDAKTSIAAIIILGEIGSEKSIPLLRKAVSSRNSAVKHSAIIAIDKIQDRTEE